MSIDFNKFDSMVDIEDLRKEVEDAGQNEGTRDYKEVPKGDYEVSVEKMELRESSKGEPMVTIWFNILAGEYKNSKIFMNQVITKRYPLHKTNELLRQMDTGLTIEFESYKKYNQLLMDVHEAIDGKLEFALRYGETKNGYPTFEITEVFEV